jgi:hypothetical protein
MQETSPLVAIGVAASVSEWGSSVQGFRKAKLPLLSDTRNRMGFASHSLTLAATQQLMVT